MLGRAAEARPEPPPEPSGTVIHLFGPNSVTAHLLPAEPAGAAQTPSVGAILHQMFVTGDPAQKPGAALGKGRAADRPGS
jgi:hypothetical protein